jgi:hypothetical protein
MLIQFFSLKPLQFFNNCFAMFSSTQTAQSITVIVSSASMNQHVSVSLSSSSLISVCIIRMSLSNHQQPGMALPMWEVCFLVYHHSHLVAVRNLAFMEFVCNLHYIHSSYFPIISVVLL